MASMPTQWKRESLFISSFKRTFTYGDQIDFASLFRDKITYFISGPIDQVVLLLPESELSVAIIAACWMLDITFIPLSTRWTPKEIQSRLDTLDYQLIISTEEFSTNLLPDYEPILLVDEDWLAESESNPITATDSLPEPDPNSIFAKLFTSGSSGRPKLVPLKRRQMETAARSARHNFPLIQNELWLLCLPLHHIGGISIILRSLVYGSGVYLSYPFDTADVANKLSENHQVKAVSLVPTMLRRLLQDSDLEIHKSFKGILLGGGPVDEELLTYSLESDLPLYLSYGMTETCAQIAAANIEHSNKSTGLTIFEPNEFQIRDEDQRDIQAGETGLIWLRGPQVFDGYHQKSLNRKAFDEAGWFCTGDYGLRDGAGKLYIANRRSDIVITGGENVDVREVEQALLKLSSTEEAAVLGIPDEHWGERVIAFITPKEHSTLAVSDIRQQLRNSLAGYKIPKEIIRIDELPKSGLSKIQKGKLKEMYLDEKL